MAAHYGIPPNAPVRDSKRVSRRDQATKRMEPQRHLFEHLGRTWYFVTTTYRDDNYFHFRQMDEATKRPVPDGKGIALNPYQLKLLVDAAPDVCSTVEDDTIYSNHLGYGIYITTERGDFIDIRRYFKPEHESKSLPTRKGSMLRKTEFERFIVLIPKLLEYFPAISELKPCECMSENNQLAAMFCRVCNPFDYIEF